MLFAITDIETTGSHAAGNSIIEIGIVLYDGTRVVDEFQSLIDPGVPIPPFITTLTGIDDDMLRKAPPFHQIADALEEFMEGAVFVAHNVGFDHSFIRAEFAAIGRAWNPPRLWGHEGGGHRPFSWREFRLRIPRHHSWNPAGRSPRRRAVRSGGPDGILSLRAREH